MRMLFNDSDSVVQIFSIKNINIFVLYKIELMLIIDKYSWITRIIINVNSKPYFPLLNTVEGTKAGVILT